MNYTTQVRKDIKRECKTRVWDCLGRCIGIQFLYGLPFVLLYLIMYAPLLIRFSNLTISGQLNAYRLSILIEEASNTSWLLTLLSVAISGGLMYGLSRFYIDLRRGKQPPVSTLFQPFTSGQSAWTGIKMQFCIFFRTMLWSLIPSCLATVWIIALILSARGSYPSRTFIFVGYLVLAVIFLLISVKIIAYRAGWVVLYDGGEERGVWSATREAAAVFKGHFGKLLGLLLSFFGWFALEFGLLCVCGLLFVLCGSLESTMSLPIMLLALIAGLCVNIVLGAFLQAYVETSFVGLYEYLAQAQPPVQQPYDYMPYVQTPLDAPQGSGPSEDSAPQDSPDERD